MRKVSVCFGNEIDGIIAYASGDVNWPVEFSWLEFRRENEAGVL